METARQLTEKQAKQNESLARNHRAIAKDGQAIAELELEKARIMLQQKQLEQEKADQAWRAGLMQSNIASNDMAVIQHNMALSEVNVAYTAFGAITNCFSNIVVSASIVAGFVFVPLSNSTDMTKLNADFTCVLTFFSSLALVLLLHTVYMSTEATIQGTKAIYVDSHSAATVWSSVESMTVLQGVIHKYYYAGLTAVYMVICCLVWATLDTSNGLDTRDYFVGGLCTFMLTVVPMVGISRADKQIADCFKQRAALSQIDRNQYRNFGDSEAWGLSRTDTQTNSEGTPSFRRTTGLQGGDWLHVAPDEAAGSNTEASARTSDGAPASRRETDGIDFSVFRTPGGVSAFAGQQQQQQQQQQGTEAPAQRRFSEIATASGPRQSAGAGLPEAGGDGVYHSMD